MIRIYPSKLDGEPIETHQLPHTMTIEGWLRSKVPAYDPRRRVISVQVNGDLIDPDDWATTPIFAADTVDVYPEAKGSALATIFKPGPLAKLFGLGNPFAPVKPGSTASTKTGSALSNSTIKGNQVKLNDVIREVAGTYKVYPDYLLPLRRYFTGPRIQWTEMLLCVGVGQFDIPASSILVGDTPIISLGSNAEYAIYQPGADLSGEVSAIWWHSATEVGATSTGTAGIDLTTTTAVTQSATATVFQFGGYRIDIPDGAGTYPTGWEAGMLARILLPQSYSITADGTNRAQVAGDFTTLAPFAGMKIEAAGDSSGLFTVHAFTPAAGSTPAFITLDYADGSPVIALPAGNANLSLGYAGLRYRLTGATTNYITVDRLTDTGATDTTWAGFASISSATASITLDSSTLEGNWSGPFAACPSGEVATQIEWDVFFPGGLTDVDKNGNTNPRSATTELQYRDMKTGGAWTSETRTYRQGTYDALAFTERVNLPYAMTPECRMRRIGAEASSTTAQDKVQWYGLRANIPVKKTYPGVTVMAIRVAAGGRLAADTEQQISVRPTRRLPYRVNGVLQPASATRRIDAWVEYVAKSIGYTDDDLDLDEFDRLGAVWAARGDWYDDVYTDQTTVKEAISRTLGAGFAEMTLEAGQIVPVRDEPRSIFGYMYTPQNMTQTLERSAAAIGPDEYDGVDVKFTNALNWQVDTVQCRLPGDAGNIVETYEVQGVTDRDRAWRIGMRRRRAQKWRRWNYTWSTELDALNSSYLSYDAVADDVPGYGQSALLLGFEIVAGGLLLESSEPFDWSAPGQHVVALRRPDGTLSGPWYATRVNDYSLSISGADFTPDTSWNTEPPHLLFGPVTRWCFPVLVTSTEPDGTESVNVSAIGYDARVYLDDDNQAPT